MLRATPYISTFPLPCNPHRPQHKHTRAYLHPRIIVRKWDKLQALRTVLVQHTYTGIHHPNHKQCTPVLSWRIKHLASRLIAADAAAAIAGAGAGVVEGILACVEGAVRGRGTHTAAVACMTCCCCR